MRTFFLSALIATMPATSGVAGAAEGLTDDQLDRVTGGIVVSVVDMSDFFAAHAEANGVTVETSAHADDASARATGSAQTIALDSDNVRSRAETVGVPPPPPQQEPDPVQLQMSDLWDRRMGNAAAMPSLPFTRLR